jgi:hypothetical protein
VAAYVEPQEFIGDIALTGLPENILNRATNIGGRIHQSPVHVEEVDGKLWNHSG